MLNTLLTLREEFETKLISLRQSLPRELRYLQLKDKITVFIGMRRSGKTVFLGQQINKLLDQGVPFSQILYLNFEDDRLMAPDHQVLVGLCDSFYRHYPENHDKHCYLFFDEIQNVPNWPQVVRRLLDSKLVSIYLTGSSAKLLSKEIATSLRGRGLATEVWPFSFRESLQKNQLHYQLPMGKKSFDNYMQQLQSYLHQGGFPEVLGTPTEIKNRICQDYVNVVIMRDIIERHRITNLPLIHYMIKTLLKNTATLFSPHKFFNDLKSQGISASKNTLYEYLDYIQDAYLLFSVPIYTESLRKAQANPKKIYAVDTGLVQAYTLSLSPNYGHLFENMIYLDLRRKNHEIYYYIAQTGQEVDFLSKSPSGKIALWQVCWDMEDKKTVEREYQALALAKKALDLEGEIITPENYLDWLDSL